MDTAEWMVPPSVKGPQVGQLIAAGRYRLALFKGGDDIAEVWHAVEESTQQVVTVEILRDRGDEARRTRFLEQAQRMAQIERPSVMKVVAIHDDANETFVVFEHLIPLTLELPDLETLAPDAVVPPEPVASAARPAKTVVAPAPPNATPRLAKRTVPSDAVDSRRAVLVEIEDDSDAPTVVIAPRPGPEPQTELGRYIALVKSDLSVIVAWATRNTAGARALVRQRVDSPVIRARAARLAERARPLMIRARPMIAQARPLIAKARPLLVRARPLMIRARPLLVRARHNQIVMAVVTAALVLLVFVVSPLDDAIGNAFRPAPAPAPSPTLALPATLAPAPFALPPLSAYRAAFESQGQYPKTRPNGTVEFVVALRNTGSAGWYRGIAGAQAALALADGTGVAVQSTEYVAPGQVGWFVVHFRARAEIGTYTVPLLPRIDGRGPMPDLGVHTVVTVSQNP